MPLVPLPRTHQVDPQAQTNLEMTRQAWLALMGTLWETQSQKPNSGPIETGKDSKLVLLP